MTTKEIEKGFQEIWSLFKETDKKFKETDREIEKIINDSKFKPKEW